jgi:transcriptional regulator with XRE-family HTH domain
MRQDNSEQANNSAELKKLGVQLKALREAQGLSYDDVASVTHVRPHIIKSIENGSIEEIVASVYARGFIKTYCEYLMASDLWRKYSLGALSADDSAEDEVEETEERIEIKHPTPVFRRSSIIWVYMLLVIAIFGAAYLLWSQSMQPGGLEDVFPIRLSSSADLEAASLDKNIAVTSAGMIAIALPASVDGRSADILPSPVPQSADEPASADGRIASGDIRWMDETSAPIKPLVELPQFVDKTLLIEITGSNNKLTVEQKGKVVTRRTLGIGGRRSYDVTSETKVTISAGNKARVTWFGKRYDSVGADNKSVTLIFRPDGTVTLMSGKSPHFERGASSGNG